MTSEIVPAKRSPARAIADLSAGLILASVEITAPPERVFRALTSSADVTAWWGSAEAYRTTSYEADVRVGGKWRSLGTSSDGSSFSVGGEFLVVDAPKKLVQTWKPDWDSGNTTQLTYLLEPILGGTRLTVRHEGFGDRSDSCAQHSSGWELVLGWLDGYASAAVPADARTHYVMKLIAPRKSFAFDMTEEERAMMVAHAQYWAGHLKAGTSLLYGPVNDPSGPYGIGIVRVESTAQLAELEANDPAILAKRGLRYEVAPMMRVVTRL